MLFSGKIVVALSFLAAGIATPLDDLKRDTAALDSKGSFMPRSLYQTTTTSRGFDYSVYYHPARNSSKPTILFVHGFPQSSYYWRYQAKFFQALGYAVVAPDSLGHGETDKPSDIESYAAGSVAKDMVDVLDGLAIKGPVVAVGHDLGTKIVSRLANNHAERFQGFAFYGGGYTTPNPDRSYAEVLASTAKIFGYELFGYWAFFSQDNAPGLIEQHYDSFWQAVWSFQPDMVKNNLAPTGKFEEWLKSNQTTTLPTYLTLEEINTTKAIWKNSGIAPPLNYYKTMTGTVDMDDAKKIPKENYNITKPVFFGGASKDMVGLTSLYMATMPPYCTKLTHKEYDAAHWVNIEQKDAVNKDLADWLVGLGL